MTRLNTRAISIEELRGRAPAGKLIYFRNAKPDKPHCPFILDVGTYISAPEGHRGRSVHRPGTLDFPTWHSRTARDHIPRSCSQRSSGQNKHKTVTYPTELQEVLSFQRHRDPSSIRFATVIKHRQLASRPTRGQDQSSSARPVILENNT